MMQRSFQFPAIFSAAALCAGSAQAQQGPLFTHPAVPWLLIGVASMALVAYMRADRERTQLQKKQTDADEQQKQLARLQAENEKLKTELKGYSTIINMAPFPIWQRDALLNVKFYNLSYSEAVEDDGGDSAQTPELDKKIRLMAQQAMESAKPVSERRHIVVGGERKLFQITEMPIPEEKNPLALPST